MAHKIMDIKSSDEFENIISDYNLILVYFANSE